MPSSDSTNTRGRPVNTATKQPRNREKTARKRAANGGLFPENNVGNTSTAAGNGVFWRRFLLFTARLCMRAHTQALREGTSWRVLPALVCMHVASAGEDGRMPHCHPSSQHARMATRCFLRQPHQTPLCVWPVFGARLHQGERRAMGRSPTCVATGSAFLEAAYTHPSRPSRWTGSHTGLQRSAMALCMGYGFVYGQCEKNGRGMRYGAALRSMALKSGCPWRL
jgi:hypothetical protein